MTILYSLFIKLGMFAATLGVVFWIGWAQPIVPDREDKLVAESIEGSKIESPSSVAAPKRSHKGLLDLNQATDQDLDSLPGIGPKLAERIMEYRQSVGAFHSLDELRAVKGIGKKKFERIRPLVTVTSDTRVSERPKKAT